MEMLMKPQLCVSSNATDDYLRYLRQMNISHCFVMFRNEETNYDAVNRTLERVRTAGLTVDDAGNGFLYKHPSIQLGLPDRDEWIAKYNDLNRWLGNAGVKVGYATWDTGRVSTSWWKAGEHTHGAVGRIVDMNEIYARKPAFGQEYDYDTMWNNFEYFLRAALPVCKEVGMKLALHPCDPPVRFYEGCASIIISGDDYRKALRRADEIQQELGLGTDEHYLGIKFCCGCWLEGGEKFGNVLTDLADFVQQKRVHIVHFRNVSSPLPYFEETLLEDGYMDMYKIMDVLVKNGYDGTIYVDHVLRYDEQTGGEKTSFAYATGYMKGLMAAAYHQQK